MKEYSNLGLTLTIQVLWIESPQLEEIEAVEKPNQEIGQKDGPFTT